VTLLQVPARFLAATRPFGIMSCRATPKDTVGHTEYRWVLAATPTTVARSLRASVDYYRLVPLHAALGAAGEVRLVMSGARREEGRRSWPSSG
jgi:hypothetical protein